MNDTELEARVRHTLAAVASATPIDPAASAPPPQPPPPARTNSRRTARALIAAAASIALVLGAVALVANDNNDDDDRVKVAPPAAAPTTSTQPTGLPEGFDVATAAPVFSADGAPDAVVNAYLSSRFTDYPQPSLSVRRVDQSAERVTFSWTTGRGADDPRGVILLRRSAARWAVVVATTDGVDLGDVGYDGTRMRGIVRTTNTNSMFADVLTPSGKPVRERAGRRGFGGSSFGTAGGPVDGSLELDVTATFQPVILRVQLVGGTTLSISEVRFDPPPLAPHRDYDSCFERLRAPDPEADPPQDFVHAACVASLDGTVIGSGTAGDRTWELVATVEPLGRFVSLRARDLIGGFRETEGPGPTEPSNRIFRTVIACCAMGDHSIVAASFPQGTDALRVRLADGKTFEAEAFRDAATGAGYAVVAIPKSAVTGGVVTTEVRLGDGTWHKVEGRRPMVLATADG